ncbi:MAG TPA: heavy-metal-associated domain-containing protein [Candidatus Agrococcus pullicola]|uniref:Heavy-metal-associated domain-containing protein n=1 Tax=Candidatus Agrococcus pullicola TaxID=2838429 RepID=A0A9D2CBI7_9MICO|nr:heavy-metal-associated domain-containing protein [Candidatus Agrococcus pullicola]
MKTPTRLGLYGLGLVAIFAVAGLAASALVPHSAVQRWADGANDDGHGQGHEGNDEHGAHDGETASGLSIAQDGHRLADLSTPDRAGESGELSFTVVGPGGDAVTDFDLEHEKELHLIVVRADGKHFRHVHPERDDEGVWSIPWEWDAAGSHRVFADFVPGETGEGLTLSTTVQVAGDFQPQSPDEVVAETSVNGYDVTVTGELVAGSSSLLTMTITRDGEAVTALEPYLGAFGHLVALRDGDLAYLHVHPHADEPLPGETSGPEIVFEATAPTEGRYLLFLDFLIEGEVHTAELVLDATSEIGSSDGHPEEHEDEQQHDEEKDDHDHG